MSNLVKQVLIVLLSFCNTVARVADRTKCVSLNYKLCMFRRALIGLNPVELKYYPFIISLEKCSRRCNILTPKICVSKE